jgi:hypothetical protein
MIEAMKMALDALEKTIVAFGTGLTLQQRAASVLRQAIEQAEKQEPVAWANPHDLQNFDMKVRTNGGPLHTVPLYTAPPPRQPWVGLTADEIWKCNKAKSGSAVEFHICYAHQNVLDFAEAIEAKLKEKNT